MLNIGYYMCFGFPNVGHFFNTESYRNIHFLCNISFWYDFLFAV